MSIIEFIQDRARYYNCPVCGRSLKGCEVRMLNHVDDRFTVQVTCAACLVTFSVVLAIQGQGLDMGQEPGLNELEVEVESLEGVEGLEELEGQPELDEALSADAGRGPIELDELLDVHLLLNEFDGSLTELVRQPQHKS